MSFLLSSVKHHIGTENAVTEWFSSEQKMDRSTSPGAGPDWEIVDYVTPTLKDCKYYEKQFQNKKVGFCKKFILTDKKKKIKSKKYEK